MRTLRPAIAASPIVVGFLFAGCASQGTDPVPTVPSASPEADAPNVTMLAQVCLDAVIETGGAESAETALDEAVAEPLDEGGWAVAFPASYDGEEAHIVCTLPDAPDDLSVEMRAEYVGPLEADWVDGIHVDNKVTVP